MKETGTKFLNSPDHEHKHGFEVTIKLFRLSQTSVEYRCLLSQFCYSYGTDKSQLPRWKLFTKSLDGLLLEFEENTDKCY